MTSLAPSVLIISLCSLFLGAALPSTPASVQLAPGAKLWVDGDSTLHRYHLDARTFDVAITAAGSGDLLTRVREKNVSEMQVSVLVGALTSREDGLDENLRKALKADSSPKIIFKLQSYDVIPAVDAHAVLGLQLHGTLAIAGVSRAVDVPVQVFSSGDRLRLTGEVPLTMSAFNVKAPVLFLGSIKTADAITVGFDLTIALAR